MIGLVIGLGANESQITVSFSGIQACNVAVVSFYKTLRTELGSDVTVVIVTPGLIESRMTQGKFLSKEGRMILDPDLRDVSQLIKLLETSLFVGL